MQSSAGGEETADVAAEECEALWLRMERVERVVAMRTADNSVEERTNER